MMYCWRTKIYALSNDISLHLQTEEGLPLSKYNFCMPHQLHIQK